LLLLSLELLSLLLLPLSLPDLEFETEPEIVSFEPLLLLSCSVLTALLAAVAAFVATTTAAPVTASAPASYLPI
jgi:hypothetical protein